MRSYQSIALLFALTLPLAAQDSVAFDNSGNGLLKGVYNFRQVAWQVGDDAGNLSKAAAYYGTITFDGNGSYNLNASVWDSRTPSVQPFTLTGTYVISASGLGRLSSTLFPTDGLGIFGLVSQGVFIGSSTEDGVNDLFIAAPAASTPPTGADFKGAYWVGAMNFPNLTVSQARDAFFQLAPDGQGGLGSVNLTGYIGNGAKVTQSLPGSRYAFTNGTAALTFGGTTNAQSLVNATQTMYMSPDGNIIFGGSNQGWDFFVGVRALSGAATNTTFKGDYYTAGMDLDETTLGDGYATLDSYYGAFKATAGNVTGHQRLYAGFDDLPYDYTYSDTYDLASGGTYDDYLGIHYFVGADGGIRLGVGQQGFLGINLTVRAPNLSGPGVYLHPLGILNAASFAPFTVGVSPGELLSLFGTNLAAGTRGDPTFPATLNGVQVLINNRPAPIYTVSETQLSVLVPWATSGGVASIRVINSGVSSNTVTVFNNVTTPGVFTQTQNGIGYAAALHPDGSLVTPGNPARVGETVAVFLTGLGAVKPAVSDGALGPVDPLSTVSAALAASVSTTQATIAYKGLAPQLRGLYQLNVTIPSGAAPGDRFLNVSGPDSYNSEVLLPIGPRAGAESVEKPVLDQAPSLRRGRGRPAGRVPRGAPRLLVP